jgi:hypothetical protein
MSFLSCSFYIFTHALILRKVGRGVEQRKRINGVDELELVFIFGMNEMSEARIELHYFPS